MPRRPSGPGHLGTYLQGGESPCCTYCPRIQFIQPVSNPTTKYRNNEEENKQKDIHENTASTGCSIPSFLSFSSMATPPTTPTRAQNHTTPTCLSRLLLLGNLPAIAVVFHFLHLGVDRLLGLGCGARGRGIELTGPYLGSRESRKDGQYAHECLGAGAK